MTSNDSVIQVQGLQKSFGTKHVLRDVSFCLTRGTTLALLGRNGAGKTTIIRTLMGLLLQDAGTVRIAGLDPQADSLEVRRRVGFLAEDQQMFGWMSVDQLIRFIAAFYPAWDHRLAAQLVEQYGLDLRQKVRYLSKGQNIRLGLLLAMAQNADVMILDDPALALDPIMRKEFNRDLVAHLHEREATLLYSSHLLAEVEAVADHIAILHEGKIVKHAGVEELREEVKQLVFPAIHFRKLNSRLQVLDLEHSASDVAIVVDNVSSALAVLGEWEIEPQVVDLNLDEIFEAFVIGRRSEKVVSTVPVEAQS